MHRRRTPGAVRRAPGTAAELECRIAASPEPEHGRFRTTDLETLSDHGRSQAGPTCRQSARLANGDFEVSAAAEEEARQGTPGVRGSPAGVPPWQARLEDSLEPSRSGSSLSDVPALKTTVWRMVTSVHAICSDRALQSAGDKPEDGCSKGPAMPDRSSKAPSHHSGQRRHSAQRPHLAPSRCRTYRLSAIWAPSPTGC